MKKTRPRPIDWDEWFSRGNWPARFEPDGRAHHYPPDSPAGKQIIAELIAHAELDAPTSAPVARQTVGTGSVRPENGSRLPQSIQTDSASNRPNSRAADQVQRAQRRSVIADTGPADGSPNADSRRCAQCGRDIDHKRAGARVCGDTCRKALARKAGAIAAAEDLSALFDEMEVTA